MSDISPDEVSAWATTLQKNILLYPCEPVVRWLASVSSRHPKGSSALDVGFGSGQHLKLFMDYGFRAYGTELIPNAIEQGEKILKGRELGGNLTLGDLDHSSLEPESFHLSLAWGSFFLKPKTGISWNLEKMRDLMTMGGDFCLNFRTKDNWFHGLGEEVDESCFRLDQRAEEYQNMVYTFLDKDEAKSLCQEAGFEIINMERVELFKRDMSQRHSWFVMWLRCLG